MYSQNTEQDILISFFTDRNITCLSIGENDGINLSNVRQLILNGCHATLVEPAPEAFRQLTQLYLDRRDVHCINVAVSNYKGRARFFDSGSHLGKGDLSLVSSLSEEETKRWLNSTKFNEIEVDVVDFKTLLNLSRYKKFQLNSVDAEGNDVLILKQINLKEIGCEVICIEHNSHAKTLKEIIDYCCKFGLTKQLLKNHENIILSI
jgi:FkbM family methyltransferase